MDLWISLDPWFSSLGVDGSGKKKDGQHGQVLPEMLQQKLVMSMPDFWLCLSWSHSSSWTEYWTPLSQWPFQEPKLPYCIWYSTFILGSWNSHQDGSAPREPIGMGWFSPCPVSSHRKIHDFRDAFPASEAPWRQGRWEEELWGTHWGPRSQEIRAAIQKAWVFLVIADS